MLNFVSTNILGRNFRSKILELQNPAEFYTNFFIGPGPDVRHRLVLQFYKSLFAIGRSSTIILIRLHQSDVNTILDDGTYPR